MKTKLLFVLIIISTQLTIYAQNEKTMKDFKPTIRKVDKMQMIYYSFRGPYMQSFNNFGQLMGYIQQNQIPTGPYSLGLYYDDPETVPEDELRSDVGFMVKEPVKDSDKYKYKEIKGGKAVSVKYKAMEDIYPAYKAIGEYIAENNLKTRPYSIEIYYSSDPSVIDAEILMFLEE